MTEIEPGSPAIEPPADDPARDPIGQPPVEAPDGQEAARTLEREAQRRRADDRHQTAEAEQRANAAWQRELEQEVERLRGQLDEARDEIERMRREREADPAPRPDPPASGDPRSPSTDGEPLSVDERIWALRLHLQDIHRHEKEEHARTRFFARLSRFWRRPGPARGQRP